MLHPFSRASSKTEKLLAEVVHCGCYQESAKAFCTQLSPHTVPRFYKSANRNGRNQGWGCISPCDLRNGAFGHWGSLPNTQCFSSRSKPQGHIPRVCMCQGKIPLTWEPTRHYELPPSPLFFPLFPKIENVSSNCNKLKEKKGEKKEGKRRKMD